MVTHNSKSDLPLPLYKTGLLEDKLLQFMDYDSEKFICILLLARQASLEPGGKFGTYAKFYEHFFVSNKEVIGCSKKLTNLFKNCLSPLVPFEPASVLRTHLSNQIQVPLNLRQIASDYYMLARTRLKDLKGE